MPNYQLQARYVFLTYAQCDVSKEDLLDHLTTDLPKQCLFALVGHERHLDGGDHLHAFLDFGDKLRTRNQRYFDFRGYHPNVQGARNPKEAYEYCKKDGDFVCDGEVPTFSNTAERNSRASASKQAELWGGILDDATDRASFLQLVRERAPDKLVLNFSQVEAYADRYFNADSASNYQPQYTEFQVPEPVQQWLDTEFDPEVSLNRYTDPAGLDASPFSICCLGVPIRDPALSN